MIQVNGSINDFRVIGIVCENAIAYRLKSGRLVATFRVETQVNVEDKARPVEFQCVVWNSGTNNAARLLKGTRLYAIGNLLDAVVIPELPHLWQKGYVFVVNEWVLIDKERGERESARKAQYRAEKALRDKDRRGALGD